MTLAEMNELKVFIVRVRIAELIAERDGRRAYVLSVEDQKAAVTIQRQIDELEKLLEEGGYE